MQIIQHTMTKPAFYHLMKEKTANFT